MATSTVTVRIALRYVDGTIEGVEVLYNLDA